MTAKTHKDFIPPWMDCATLCAHICVVESTVEKWVSEGILPPPRTKGGKRMWKWSEVDEMLTAGGSMGDRELERIRDASKRAEAH